MCTRPLPNRGSSGKKDPVRVEVVNLHVEPIAWVPEDELPESLTQQAYDALYPYSRVDIIRWFPVFAPTSV